jgi:hypothetical protein
MKRDKRKVFPSLVSSFSRGFERMKQPCCFFRGVDSVKKKRVKH